MIPSVGSRKTLRLPSLSAQDTPRLAALSLASSARLVPRALGDYMPLEWLPGAHGQRPASGSFNVKKLRLKLLSAEGLPAIRQRGLLTGLGLRNCCRRGDR